MSKKKILIIILVAVLSIATALITVSLILKHTKKAVLADPPSSSSVTGKPSDSSSVIESIADTSSDTDNGIKLVLSSPTSATVNTTEPVFTFSGTSDPEEPLTLNGNELKREEGGIFTHTANLSVGKNVFTFVHKGETKIYTVNYRYVIIKNYTQSTAQTYSSGSTFGVYVTARNGSNVTATFNGQTITLTKVSQENADKSDFIGYTGSFKLPGDNFSDLNMGQITFKATFDGKSESFKSGKITCKRPDFIVEYDPNATPLGGRYINVGSGKITEIVDYQAETFDAKSTNDWSRPTNNYLPKGTVDYSAQTYSYYTSGSETKKYAILRCGRQVYTSRYDKPGKEYVTVVKEYAGTLPDHNEVGIVSLQNTGRHTVLTMDCLWKAPFYFDILPQQYANPNRQDYTVSNVTSNYIDITFCYATVFNGELPDLTDNPIFKEAKLIKGTADHTLRLYLRKQGGFYGWDCYYNDAGQLVFEFLNPAKITDSDNAYGKDLSGVVVLIDVGHGGIDIGAPGFDQKNHNEAIQNLLLANKIKTELQSIGATVHLTRTTNITSTTDDKMTMIKRLKPDYCIAVHHNSSTYSGGNGFDSYYHHSFAQKAASYVYMHTSNTGIYKKNGLGWHYYFMCRSTVCPVVLTENGYISNSFDYKNIVSEQVNLQKAKAITKGIVEYFTYIQ